VGALAATGNTVLPSPSSSRVLSSPILSAPGNYNCWSRPGLATAATLLRSALLSEGIACPVPSPAGVVGPRVVGMAAAGTQLGRLLGGLWFLAALLGRPGATAAAPAVAAVDGRRAVAATGEDFVCATLDWWPPDKCDYGTCAWGRAGLLNLVSHTHN
jgi:hypothetical protein